MINANLSWAEKYRPKNFNDLIYPNNKWKNIIEDWIKNKKIGGNIALFGKGAIGPF